jgi:thiol:disulfide interchange protein
LKLLLTVIAFFEGITGLALLAVPSFFVSIVLGATLHESSGILIGRLAGIALVSLAIACWSYRNEKQNSAGIFKAMLFYNMAAAGLLIYASLIGFSGMGLWPAAVLHIGLGVWCIFSNKRD